MSTAQKQKLAIDGGPKAIDKLEGKGQPKIGHEEFLAMADTWGYSQATIEKIRQVIEKEELGGGPFLNRYYNPKPSKAVEFQEEARKLFGAKYTYPVTSGTAALHTAYVAADLGCGEEVIVPGFTFFATAAAAVAAHAMPVWCEIDESMTIDAADIERKITPRTKAIAPVHMSGCVCNMDAVMEIARKHSLLVIEDCAQAFGCSFKGKRIGTIGDIGCFSISSYKVTGGGECGIVVTDNEALMNRAMGWAECGGLWRPDRFAEPRWKGELFCGTNYRLSELEGTVNLIQIRKADAQLARWRTNKRRIIEAIPAYKELKPVRIWDVDGEMGSSIGALATSIPNGEKLAAALQAEGVSAGTRGSSTRPDWHYCKHMWQVNKHMPATSDGCPWNCPKVLERGGPPVYGDDPCPRTEDLTRRCVRVGVNQWWTESDCAKVSAALTKVFDAYYTRDAGKKNWLVAATQ
jgi:8-amino-3,8-dideoxy-alpha-D-manno-octulosonate transaminase